jgi:predicted kinase
MTPQPKLILLNGAAGVGKTTIARMYRDQHPLALSIEGDELIAMIGSWLQYENQARDCVLDFTLAMANSHLQQGYDVIVPYLLTAAEDAEAFEALAQQHGAQFFEILLMADKQEAIRRLYARGRWGEPNAPPLTAQDQPVAESLYDRMMAAATTRPRTIAVPSAKDDAAGTYRSLMQALANPPQPQQQPGA